MVEATASAATGSRSVARQESPCFLWLARRADGRLTPMGPRLKSEAAPRRQREAPAMRFAAQGLAPESPTGGGAGIGPGATGAWGLGCGWRPAPGSR
jgi:hypothetical protein